MSHLAFLEWGPTGGRTILLVHGGGDNAATWWKIGPRLADLGHVVAADLPGHGRSDPLPETFADHPPGFHESLLDVVGDHPLVYVGHSLGAPVVLSLARLRPPKGIVLVDGSPHRRIFEPPGPFNRAVEEANLRARGYGEVLTAAEVEAKVAKDQEPEAVRRAYVQREDGRYDRRPSLADTLAMAEAGHRADNPYLDLALYSDVQVPTAVLAATNGTAADVRDKVDALYAKSPNITCTWREASHSLHWDRPEAVIEAVQQLATKT